MSAPKPSQRDRLVEAMTVVAARYGYGDASVARVVKEAGVSRATFYEQFEDKEACFLAAYCEVVGRLRDDLAEEGFVGRGPALLQRLLDNAKCDPAAARVALIESLAGPPTVRTEHRRLLDLAEATVERYIQEGSRGAGLEIPARALLGGLIGVVSTRVFRGEAGHLGALADDLVAWIESYALPADMPLLRGEDWFEIGEGIFGSEPDSLGEGVLSSRLPRGRGAAASSVVTGQQRERILAAVARLAREKGYAEMTVRDVVATAGVTRESFYAQFRGKTDAFLAAQAFGLERSVSLTAGKFFGGESWPERVWNGLEAMLRYVAGQQDLVFVDMVESYAAGPPAIRRSFENRMAYTLFLEDGYRQRPQAEGLPRICSEAISGAIHELMRRQVVDGRTEQMLQILPQAVYVSLAPFVGPKAALRLIEERSGRPIPRSRARPDAG